MSEVGAAGVPALVNGIGTLTRLAGSRMPDEVARAMTSRVGDFVRVDSLARAAEARIAQLLGVPGACITSGAAAGLAVSSAACIAGADPAAILRLPDTSGLNPRVVMMKAHRIRYDQAIRQAGAEVIEVGTTSSVTPEEIRYAVKNAAMFLYINESRDVRGSLPLETVSAILRDIGVPLVVDLAAEVPPKSVLSSVLARGANLVVLSGGKAIRGPQSSGLILGDERLIENCRLNNFPNYSIGRPMKFDRETILGIEAAVARFAAVDDAVALQQWAGLADQIARELADIPGSVVSVRRPTTPGVEPRIVPRAYFRSDARPSSQLAEELQAGDPAILVLCDGDDLVINPQCLNTAECRLITDRIRGLCTTRA